MKFQDVGLLKSQEDLFLSRAAYSQGKLEALASNLKNATHTGYFKSMAIYAAGSYGRLEASSHSDIDLFFVLNRRREEFDEFHVPEIQLLSEIIGIGYKMDFPKFSNDGEFLRILFIDEVLKELGSRADDFFNHFTGRMLLLLESRPVFGSDIHSSLLKQTVESYFRDYPYHPKNFRPTFLINDILRYWKTLCLNYEHRRNQEDERTKIKQKVKNFKLKYSRLMTCFATVAKLGTYRETISPEEVTKICHMTPAERLRSIAPTAMPALSLQIKHVLELYCWFLEKTALSTEQLELYFTVEKNRQEAFDNAQAFGDSFFEILKLIDQTNHNMRYLVV